MTGLVVAFAAGVVFAGAAWVAWAYLTARREAAEVEAEEQLWQAHRAWIDKVAYPDAPSGSTSETIVPMTPSTTTPREEGP